MTEAPHDNARSLDGVIHDLKGIFDIIEDKS